MEWNSFVFVHSRVLLILKLLRKLLTTSTLYTMNSTLQCRFTIWFLFVHQKKRLSFIYLFILLLSTKYQEGIDALEEVIYHIETYDVTTIRASTPMFLMSRKIKSLGVKMVLSGEGSDEIFGGYLYFHKAPNKKEFHEETCRKVMEVFTGNTLLSQNLSQ